MSPNTQGGVLTDPEKLRRIEAMHRPNAHYDPGLDFYGANSLLMRLRLRNISPAFDYLNVQYTKTKVFVFVIQNDEAVVLEDDHALYPSDALVAKLNLLRKK